MTATARLVPGFGLVALSFAIAAAPLAAQSLEGRDRPAGEARPARYLAEDSTDHRLLVGPPPTPDGLLDTIDMDTSRRFQALPANDPAFAARWALAQDDNRQVYPQFAEAFGQTIDRATSPALVMLLNRAMRDFSAPTFRAKRAYQRPRPYQRYQLTRRCGNRPVPAPDAAPRGGSSYPSGHTVYGWGTALILSDVAPDRAPALLERGRDYALSRVICGYHFPSDTDAARAIASAVLVRLQADPTFRADRDRARTEYRSANPVPTATAPPPPVVEAQPVEPEGD